ncbi:MAG: RtcB family protein [archaeon]
MKKFERGEYDKSVSHYIRHTAIKHLGTLGGGNHFIELGFQKNDLWLIIHSGSRGVGHKIAEIYMKKAAGKDRLFEQTYPLEVESKYGKEYLNVLDFCLEFALLNRMEMAHHVILSIGRVLRKKISWKLWANKNHNHAILEKTGQGELYIHRKGATPAKKGERGIIPANMRDGSYLVLGLGNAHFLFSSSHGAGRVMSRTKARETFKMQEFIDSMKGIRGTIEPAILDEAPMAYKNIADVMDAQKESVKVLKHIKPVINWKGK